MKQIKLFSATLIAVSLLPALLGMAQQWKQLPSLPDREGFAAAFAGVSNGTLLFAGGANFPDKKPWEGGKKVWYDQVFALHDANSPWKVVGRLPRPLAYGVSLTYHDQVICIGGSNETGHFADAFRLEWVANELTLSPFPSLPHRMANGAGAIVGDYLYVVGGQETPESQVALDTVWRIDLRSNDSRWESIPPLPNRGRILSVAVAHSGSLFVLGGASLSPGQDGKPNREYLRDTLRYDERGKWRALPALPVPSVAAPSPAPTNAEGFYLLGGDDGSQVNASPENHAGFHKHAYFFHIEQNRWSRALDILQPRVTVPCVQWNQTWVIPSGEKRPGSRSPEVWSLAPEKKD